MEFGLDSEQIALRDAVRALLAKRSGSAAVRAAVETPGGYDENLWHILCQEIGVAALAIPEEYGGTGASHVEMHVVLEELGRTLTPCPLLGSAVLAAQAVLASADVAACERILPDIASGERIAALAWSGIDGQWAPERPACTVTQSGHSSTVDGEAGFVLDGSLADTVIVVAASGSDVGLYEIPADHPAVDRTALPTMDQTRSLARLRFSGAPARRIGGDATDALRHVRDLACIALSADQVGLSSRSLELTVEYVKQRRQFGRAIGSFQALKHRLADAYVRVDSARSASYAAAFSAALGNPELPQDAAIARVTCSEAAREVTAEMIQLHGGIAITWEHDAHLYFKRAHSSAYLFGQPEEHLARFAALAGNS